MGPGEGLGAELLIREFGLKPFQKRNNRSSGPFSGGDLSSAALQMHHGTFYVPSSLLPTGPVPAPENVPSWWKMDPMCEPRAALLAGSARLLPKVATGFMLSARLRLASTSC